MCSNISLSSCGGGDIGEYGRDGICSKRPKRQKIPKRGPGVAELEKILREQEKKNEEFSLVPPVPNSYESQSPILPSSQHLPENLLFASDPNHFSPPRAALCPNNGSITPLRGGGGGKIGGHIGGSGIILGEHALLPTMCNFCEPSMNVESRTPASRLPHLLDLSSHFFPPSILMQRNQCSPPSMINLSSCSSSTSSCALLCHGIEPPSSQTLHRNYTSLWPEEDQVVGRKRSFPLAMEIPLAPFRCQIPAFSPRISRLPDPSSSSSRNGCGIINLEPSEADTRELKQSSSLEPRNLRKCSSDYGAPDRSFMLFGSTTAPSTHASTSAPSTHASSQEPSKFNLFPVQESMVNSQHRPGFDGSVQEKPFFNLNPREQMSSVEKKFDSNNDTAKTREMIDLSLRL